MLWKGIYNRSRMYRMITFCTKCMDVRAQAENKSRNVNSGYLWVLGLWIFAFLLISFDVAQFLK